MGLEHRWNQRKPVQVQAIILYPPLGLLRGRVLNVSADGALIDTGCITLPPHALVNLTFALAIDGKQRLYQMAAMVMHQGGNRFHGNRHGMLFKDFALEEALSTVRAIMEAAA
ncbi:MAG: PilZ domain-containing protein [Pseudomonadota bacterium]